MGPPEVNWKWKGAIVGPMSRCSRCATSHVRHPWIPCSVVANLLLQLLTDRITIAMAVCEIQTQYNHIIIIVTSTKSLFQFPYTVICGLCVGSSCASPLLLELRLSGIVMKGPQAEPLVRIVSACMVMKQLDCSVALFSSRSGHSPMSSALCWLKASIWRGCEGTL